MRTQGAVALRVSGSIRRSKAGRTYAHPRSVQSQISELTHHIHNPPPSSIVMEFSPKLAEYVLQNLADRKNRHKKPGKIKKYADDLEQDRWGLTGDTIKFGTDHLLKDGQNRLAACVRAGRVLKTHVVFGIDPQLFVRMDIGKNRTGADVFTITGIPYAGHVAGAVRWLLILTSRNPADRGAQFSNEDLLQAYNERFDRDRLDHSIRAALEVRRSTRHPVAPLAALHYLFAEKELHKADAFYEEWAYDRARKARAPTRYLQRRLVEAARASNKRLHENVRNGLIIRAWNAYVAGRSLKKAEMQHAPSDPMPKIAG
jgi:hypothetical protein